MASNIEVAEEGPAAGVGGGGGRSGAAVELEALRNDVHTAAACGDLEKLQLLVEVELCSVSEPDRLGYFALQWAALNNRPVHHRDVWTAWRRCEFGGSHGAGGTALECRARPYPSCRALIERRSSSGCSRLGRLLGSVSSSTAHVAAQYGQPAFLYHIITKWNANPDVPDNDGRSLLHCFLGCLHGIC